MNRPSLAAGALVAAMPAAGALAQPANHIGAPLAQIMIANGCEMTQQAAHDALIASGWFASDFQAQTQALFRGGYLTSETGGSVLKLVNWEPCN